VNLAHTKIILLGQELSTLAVSMRLKMGRIRRKVEKISTSIRLPKNSASEGKIPTGREFASTFGGIFPILRREGLGKLFGDFHE
jgi:hypothetical protein